MSGAWEPGLRCPRCGKEEEFKEFKGRPDLFECVPCGYRFVVPEVEAKPAAPDTIPSPPSAEAGRVVDAMADVAGVSSSREPPVHSVAVPAARRFEQRGNAETELPPPPPSPVEQYDGDMVGTVARHVLYLGAFSHAVTSRARGSEVRVRFRDGDYSIMAIVYVPGGARIEDSHRVSALELEHYRTAAAAILAGRRRGEQAASNLEYARQRATRP